MIFFISLKKKTENHIIIFISIEKNFDIFMIKMLTKQRIYEHQKHHNLII